MSFLGAFEKLREVTITFFLSICLSVRPSIRMTLEVKQLDSHWMDFHEIWYLQIFECLSVRFNFVWRERKNQKDATIKCLLSTSIPTCFGHHYAHLQENKDRVTAFCVLLWFCWVWLVAVVGSCVVGCEQCYTSSRTRAVTRSLFSWRWA